MIKRFSPKSTTLATSSFYMSVKVWAAESENDEHEAIQFDPCDSNGENEDNFSNFQSRKNVAQSVSDETGNVVTYTIKNKIPDNVYRAEPISNKQRLVILKQAIKWGKPAQYHVGNLLCFI